MNELSRYVSGSSLPKWKVAKEEVSLQNPRTSNDIVFLDIILSYLPANGYRPGISTCLKIFFVSLSFFFFFFFF